MLHHRTALIGGMVAGHGFGPMVTVAGQGRRPTVFLFITDKTPPFWAAFIHQQEALFPHPPNDTMSAFLRTFCHVLLGPRPTAVEGGGGTNILQEAGWRCVFLRRIAWDCGQP